MHVIWFVRNRRDSLALEVSIARPEVHYSTRTNNIGKVLFHWNFTYLTSYSNEIIYLLKKNNSRRNDDNITVTS